MSSDESSDDEDYDLFERPCHIVFNWSMTGDLEAIEPFCKKINYAAIQLKADVQVSVAPPAPYIIKMRKLLKQKIAVCSQTCNHEEAGAFTGEVSGSMLRSVKAAGVICGHWERRRRYGEDPGVVALQVQRATENRMNAFLCFGETMQEREYKQTMEVIKSQLSVLFELPIDWRKVVLVYQPIWSFKDEKLVACEVKFPDNEDQLEEVEANENFGEENVEEGKNESEECDDQKFGVILPPKTQHIDNLIGDVRMWLRNNASKRIAWTTSILYGGHVTSHNGPEFVKMKNIDGLLVDRKSLILEDVVDGDVGKPQDEGNEGASEDFEDFLQLVRRCNEEKREDTNLNSQLKSKAMEVGTKKKGVKDTRKIGWK